MANPTKWGLVATLKAGAEEILAFAAWHLEMGAHRLFLYLDAPCPRALPHLKAHPKIRVIETDAAHWEKRRGRIPEKHQVRQSLNATRAYRRQAKDLDWLIHMDVDEFLTAESSIAAALGALHKDRICARVRPLERLAGSESHYKARIPPGPDQEAIAARLYPRFGPYLKGGFISHVQGKLFLRTGLDGAGEDVEIRIHNAFVNGEENPGPAELAQVDLCHHHSNDWDHWMRHYRYRLEKGSYRADLAPARSRDMGGVTLHELLSQVESLEGEAGLRVFFNEVCADSPDLRARLEAEGLFRSRRLPLSQARARQFPKFG
ncbi:glycosyltransferase family 2 protein [Phaeobacter sp. HF9A]|uniref:glycosyltransferase family 2 protein n=1 Tax=Phaeobacter sp. HF9A TaxID=2721561 RepID=UPI001431038B|nr:glycosyltransferase family 2 protein [Phaeobacter sp. HF9A]NIZ13703.1 glycosyltransferase family 2 protein [Phaeobacter sp. HF9A]